MLQTLDRWDVELFRLLNGWHTTWMDPVMEALSSRMLWIPGYVLIAYFLVRTKGWKDLMVFGVITGLMVILSDQIASGILKPWMARWRPCRPEAGLDFVVHIVNGHCGGKYSFASSHAANFFTMATLFSHRFQARPWPFIFLLLACLTGYSRIYLGVHYPGDILAGSLIGFLCGILGWIGYGYWSKGNGRKSMA